MGKWCRLFNACLARNWGILFFLFQVPWMFHLPRSADPTCEESIPVAATGRGREKGLPEKAKRNSKNMNRKKASPKKKSPTSPLPPSNLNVISGPPGAWNMSQVFGREFSFGAGRSSGVYSCAPKGHTGHPRFGDRGGRGNPEISGPMFLFSRWLPVAFEGGST